jgi:tetratricopeptide (TPR) repeat protein
MPVAVGGRLGRYEVLDLIGVGGMGEVYRARDTRLGRTVALKVLPTHVAADPSRRRRFEREARVVSTLEHPNICVLHDVAREGGVDFLVLEHLEGQTLAERLVRGPVSFDEGVGIAIQVADGLEAAHRKGVVHRDLKPGNIMLARSGVKLLDFGLARLRGDGATEDESTAALPGDAGKIVGTLPYMSPEQLSGATVDARSDVWALGVVLHEMLTGRRPFHGPTPAALTAAILEQDPPPLSPGGSAPPAALDHVVRRCLAKDPAARWQSARDVATELSWIREGRSGARGPSPEHARLHRLPWRPVLAAGLLAVAALSGAWWWRARSSWPALDPNRVVVATFENRTGDDDLDTAALMATEAVREGLLRIEPVDVVPGSTVLALAQGRLEPGAGGDPVRALAQATGAGLVVSGAAYLQGQTLQLRAEITDAVAGRPLYAVEPANGARNDAMSTVDAVRQRVTDVLAAHLLHPEFDLLVEETKPPSFAAQREFATGWRLMGSLPGQAASHFTRALELDPGFASARYELHTALNNAGDFAASREQLDLLEQVPGGLTPVLRRRLDVARANIAARYEEARNAVLDVSALAPRDVFFGRFYLGLLDLWTNRPRAAVEALSQPAVWRLYVRAASPIGTLDLLGLTGALHQLGEHERELAEARRGRGVYPHLLNAWAYEVRALVALGRLAEASALIDEVLAMPPREGYPTCCVPRGTPGLVMLDAAEELRAHGHRDASVKLADRAARWWRSRPEGWASQEGMRASLGRSLYQAERWDDARALFAALATERPDDFDYRVSLGVIAARAGDRAEAERTAGQLRQLVAPYTYGAPMYASARITALLGDEAKAVDLLRDAIAQGAGSAQLEPYGFAFSARHDMDLEPLRGYAPFEELIRPKG